jgi:hypothetical protein
MVLDFVERHFDNVGDRFAEVALKIHRGEEDQRNIRGTTTSAEEEVLRKRASFHEDSRTEIRQLTEVFLDPWQ